ncbi:calmodulin-like protein 3 [Arachis stenosperma]|uniref:calmodulin-like protein 3 n=1 Tax=Arachis stenosperma TaxID=217475 RepID=UPI0025AC5CE1|nr:calmodulin-like protein 3 [Arachis stenosperma]
MNQLADFGRIFQMFDHDDDGKISKEELLESVTKLGLGVMKHDLIQMIARLDANGDGYVDFDEFERLYKNVMGDDDVCGGGGDEEEDMKEAFKLFDQNGDGFVSGEELSSVLCSLGLRQGKKTLEDCKNMIKKVDLDGDGMLDFKEFKQMIKLVN